MRGRRYKEIDPRGRKPASDVKNSSGKRRFDGDGIDVPRAEKAEIKALRRQLLSELGPTTPLQDLAFDNVVSRSWCWRSSMRQDAEESRERTAEAKEQDGVGSDSEISMSRFYGADRATMLEAIRFLSMVLSDFERNGMLREEWKESLIKGFGDDFYADLTKWKSGNLDAILLANHLATHARVFRLPLPPIKAAPEVVVDLEQNSQMVSKLLSQKLCHLREIVQLFDLKVKAVLAGRNLDSQRFPPSRTAMAMNELQRALQFFRYLKRRRL